MSEAKAFLSARRDSYRRTFDLNNADVQAVLKDLARFCRAQTSTFHEDSRMAAVLDGRREVWLRIQSHLQLPEEELWRLFGAG